MKERLDIFLSRPVLTSSLGILVVLICSFHLFNRLHLDLTAIVANSALIFFFSLTKEIQNFLFGPKKQIQNYLLVLFILLFSGIGIILNIQNSKEIGFFVILFLSFYLIFKLQDKNLNYYIFDLIIFSGIFISIGVFIGLLESLLFSSKIFYHTYDGYAYIDKKYIYSGFGFNHNYSAYIIITAQSFLFINASSLIQRFRVHLAFLFFIALLVTSAKITFLFIALLLTNYIFKDRFKKNCITILLLISYIFLSHVVIGLSGQYDFETSHYREMFFSVAGLDFIIGFYGYLKEAYFSFLIDNMFLPIGMNEIKDVLLSDPHCLIYSLIIIGGFPLALSVLTFLITGFYKNYQNIEENYPKFFLCGLICIITETLVWDANDSIFFWVLIMYALTAPNENITLNDKYKSIDH